MTDRVAREIELIRKYYPDSEVSETDIVWVRIGSYKMPLNTGWNKETTEVAFNFQTGYPGAQPYGIYVPADLLFNGQNTFLTNVQFKPPFDGNWSMISWAPENWRPLADLVRGANMLNFVRSFSERFKEGG